MSYLTEDELALDAVLRNLFNVSQSISDYKRKGDIKYLKDAKEMLEYSVLITNKVITSKTLEDVRAKAS